MKVFLRQRKQTKKGTISLYLEIYKGYAETKDGKRKPIRDYEYLDLYLIDKPSNPIDKQQNKENLKLAESIKAKRELEIKNGTYGFTNEFKKQTNFIEYFRNLVNKKESKGNFGNWYSTQIHLENYAGRNVTFKDIDLQFAEGFKEYLNKVKRKDGKPLANNSKASYFAKFRASLNEAVKEKIIYGNPAVETGNFNTVESQREYLTLDEVRKLAQTECRYDVLKRAFLFSCLTGLRWSDINNLKWNDVQQITNSFRIHFKQQKTKGQQYLDINQQARELMQGIGKPDERVFIGLNYSSYMNVALQMWILKAGITKQITFHCARHTFAVLQLTLGTEIYTLSKMLGHSELKTTQIYAKIVDEKIKEAVNKIPDINL
ncbi:MAG: site-specific integrase [Saprospiraceae bacterium]|jgi:integrase/recombinase XerD|nr:site-specific integrase [Saprospiraceae bacterium]